MLLKSYLITAPREQSICLLIFASFASPLFAPPSVAQNADTDTGLSIASSSASELLRTFSKQAEANSAQIQTWKGTFEVVDRILIPTLQNQNGQQVTGPFLQEFKSSFEFEVDTARSLSFSRYRVIGTPTYTPINSSAPIETFTKPIDVQSILSPEAYLAYNSELHEGSLSGYPEVPIASGRGQVIRKATVETANSRRSAGDVLQPMDLFCTSPKISFAKTFEILERRVASSTNELPTELKTIGGSDAQTQITWCAFAGPKKKQYSKMVCSAPDNNLPISVTTFTSDLNSTPVTSRSWQYDRRNGVLVPKAFHFQVYEPGTTTVRVDRRMVLSEYAINEPSVNSDFTYKRFRAPEGTRYVDEITRQLYVVDASNRLVDASNYRPNLTVTGSDAEQSRVLRYAGLALSGAAVIVCCVLIWLRAHGTAS